MARVVLIKRGGLVATKRIVLRRMRFCAEDRPVWEKRFDRGVQIDNAHRRWISE